MSALVVYLTGCGGVKFWDQRQVGRFRPVPAVNVILDTLGVAEETDVIWKDAEDPTPVDIIAYETDYTIGSGDIIQISIFELLNEGQLFIDQYAVTESGKITIPEVGILHVLGLSEAQIEDEIRRILLAGILKEPSVSVILVDSQRRTFSIMGNGVPRPGRYSIPRYDFRLTDALSTAGGPAQFNVSYFYISRPITGEEPLFDDSVTGVQKNQEPGKLKVPEDQMLEIIAPSAHSGRNSGFVITTAEMATNDELNDELVELAMPQGLETFNDTESVVPNNTKTGQWIFQDGKWVFIQPQADEQEEFAKTDEPQQKISDQETIKAPIDSAEAGQIEWVFQDGRWLPVQTGEPLQDQAIAEARKERVAGPLESKMPRDFEWSQQFTTPKTRVISIPADKLYGGDPRYNVIIRPGDSIHVPVDIIGEFYIMGNTNFTGAVDITGRPITLKMAIAVGGGLGPLAWPKRCEV
ncbi:MAG: polysaccharide biosynthesis/export family protein, partial [Spirochaetes bacterium]|nr:polysaccharide biosynthesis/export family protein [Spirochaetota bacterium]